MNDEYRQVLGRILAEKRVAAGLSKQQLALMVGVNRLTVRRIETGEANPTVSILIRITQGLGTSLADVLVECERSLQSAKGRVAPIPAQLEVGPMRIHYFLTRF